MTREQILEQLRSKGITSLEDLADRAVREAGSSNAEPNVKIVEGSFISILT